MLRASLITAIFEKATELDIGELDPSKSLTLMSTDVERTIRGLLDMHDMWANIIQVAISTWLIQTELGVASVAPIIVALGTPCQAHTSPSLVDIFLVSLGATMGLAGLTAKYQVAWVSMIQNRISESPFHSNRF